MDEVFALGPATIDPRTGEILHSGIVFTNGWIKSWSASFEIYGDSPDDEPSARYHVVRVFDSRILVVLSL